MSGPSIAELAKLNGHISILITHIGTRHRYSGSNLTKCLLVLFVKCSVGRKSRIVTLPLKLLLMRKMTIHIALAEVGIRLYGGVSGSVDKAVNDLLAGNLKFNADISPAKAP